MYIDCSRNALNSKFWDKNSDTPSSNVVIGYFNDNFVGRYGEVEGTSIHASNVANGNISTLIKNDELENNKLGNIEIDWAGRNDGSYAVEIHSSSGIRDSDTIQKVEDNNLYAIKKTSSLNYKNGDILVIRETGGTGVMWLNYVKLESSSPKIMDCIRNIAEDVNFIDRVNKQMNKWENSGISIPDNVFDNLDMQKKNANNKLESLHQKILKEVNILDRVDKDIKSHKGLNINIEDNLNLVEKNQKAINYYEQVINNLDSSIQELEHIRNELNRFADFGANIGNALENIDVQIYNFEEKLLNSTNEFNNIGKEAENYSNMIDELRE